MRTRTFLIAMIAAAALLVPAASYAGVSVNIGIGLGIPAGPPPPPPPVVVSAPPAMVLIPGLSVYFAPDVDANIFFYSGSWWRFNDGYWYRGRSYRGPWGFVPRGRVPVVFGRIPHDWRDRGDGRIPYGQWKKHWREYGRYRHYEGHHEDRGGWGDRGDRGDRGRGHGGWGHGRGDD